jgi:hypothetical protein
VEFELVTPIPTRSVCLLLVALPAAALGGCAAGALSQGYLGPETGTMTAAAVAAAPETTATATPEDAEADCKRLAGKVQLRLLEVRSGMPPWESSALLRSLQTPGDSTGGSGGNNALARDLAELEASNKQLADRNCRSFDIAKALTGGETVPAATIPPPKPSAR